MNPPNAKPHILLVGSQLSQHARILADNLTLYECRLVRPAHTGPLFAGRHDGIIEAILLDEYYPTIPRGMRERELPRDGHMGALIFKKLQLLLPATVFFLFADRRSKLPRNEPNLVILESLSEIKPNRLSSLITHTLRRHQNGTIHHTVRLR